MTDFGMSTHTNAAAPRLASMTQCPPTCLPKLSVSLQGTLKCFSLGLLIVQVITRQFPVPSDDLQSTELFDSQMRRIQAQVRVSELECRQSHISLIPATNPLQPIALGCLTDRDVERPTAQ